MHKNAKIISIIELKQNSEKNIMIKKVLKFIAIITLPIIASEKSLSILDNPYETHWGHRLFAQFGQSRFMHHFNRYVCDYFAAPFETTSATDDQIAYATKAQDVLNIPADKRYQCFNINTQTLKNLNLDSSTIAITGAHGLFINTEAMKLLTPSVQQATHYHEAVHYKYHDASTKLLLRLGEICLMATAAKYVFSDNIQNGIYQCLRIISAPLSSTNESVNDNMVTYVAAGILCTLPLTLNIVEQKLHAYQESRADRIALALLNCAHCVQDVANAKTSWNQSDFTQDGYATKQYCHQFAWALKTKQRHKPCKYHQHLTKVD